MPPKSTTDHHITVSRDYTEQAHVTRDHDLIFAKFRDFCDKWVAVAEHGSKGTHFHFHIACVLKRTERTDVIKNKVRFWLGLDPGVEPHAVVSKAHPDIVTLAGGYLAKEVDSIILSSIGFTDADLAAGKEKYAAALEIRGRNNPARTKLYAILAGYYPTIASGLGKGSHPHAEAAARSAILDGWNIGHILPGHIMGPEQVLRCYVERSLTNEKVEDADEKELRTGKRGREEDLPTEGLDEAGGDTDSDSLPQM